MLNNMEFNIVDDHMECVLSDLDIKELLWFNGIETSLATLQQLEKLITTELNEGSSKRKINNIVSYIISNMLAAKTQQYNELLKPHGTSVKELFDNSIGIGFDIEQLKIKLVKRKEDENDGMEQHND